MRKVFALAAIVVTGAVGWSIAALAAGDDRTQAEAIVGELDRDPAHRALTAEPVARAKAALERARGLRARGDEPHAHVADGVAREWAELARDLVRTSDVERRAADERRAANDAGARAERERALLEEDIAQNGRLRTEVEASEREAKGGAPEREKTSKLGATAGAIAGDGGAPRARGGGGGGGGSVRDGGGP